MNAARPLHILSATSVWAGYVYYSIIPIISKRGGLSMDAFPLLRFKRCPQREMYRGAVQYFSPEGIDGFDHPVEFQDEYESPPQHNY